MKLSLAYSTDLDDAFMFWPLATGRMDARDFGFDGADHVRSDTATLNAWARGGVHDVVAVSIAAVPSLAPDWLLLPHGGSVGRNYGPVIVAPRPLAARRPGRPARRRARRDAPPARASSRWPRPAPCRSRCRRRRSSARSPRSPTASSTPARSSTKGA